MAGRQTNLYQYTYFLFQSSSDTYVRILWLLLFGLWSQQGNACMSPFNGEKTFSDMLKLGQTFVKSGGDREAGIPVLATHMPRSPSACVCCFMSFWLLARRNSWWCLPWNFSRCLMQLVVLYDSALLPPLETPGINAFCYFESEISPTSEHRPLASYSVTVVLRAHSFSGMIVVGRKPRNGIWNMNRHHLSNIPWVNYINITPDTDIGSEPCVGVDWKWSEVHFLQCLSFWLFFGEQITARTTAKAASVSAPLFSAPMARFKFPPDAGWEIFSKGI